MFFGFQSMNTVAACANAAELEYLLLMMAGSRLLFLGSLQYGSGVIRRLISSICRQNCSDHDHYYCYSLISCDGLVGKKKVELN